MTTRERKAEWIRSFGISALENAVSGIIAKEGHHFLTDEQLDWVVSEIAATARQSNRRMIRYRQEHAGMPS